MSAYGAHSVLVRLVVVVPAARTRVHVAGVVGRVLRAIALTHRSLTDCSSKKEAALHLWPKPQFALRAYRA